MLPRKPGRRLIRSPYTVKNLVFNHDNRTVDAPEQSVENERGIISMIDGKHNRARQTKEMFLQALAMRGTVAASTPHRSPDDKGNVHFLVVDVAEFGSMVDQLIRGQRKKIAKHNFTDSQSSTKSQAITNSYYGCLTDRSVSYPTGEFRTQIFGDLKSASIRTLYIFSHQQNPLVASHITLQGGMNPVDHSIGSFICYRTPRCLAIPRYAFVDGNRFGVTIPVSLGYRCIDPLVNFSLNLTRSLRKFSCKNCNGVLPPIALHLVTVPIVIPFGMGHQTIRINL